MKTYNLGAGQLHFKHGDKECFCALGVFAAERGIPVKQLAEEDYSVFADHADDLKRVAEALSSASPYNLESWADDYSGYILTANDRTNWDVPPDARGYRPHVVSAEKIKEALALVGINVELNDVRGRELEWATESSST